MAQLDLRSTFQIIIIVAVAYLLVTALDEVFDRFIFYIFGLNRESIWSWLIVVFISVVLLLIILSVFKIEAHDIFGVSETVDTVLTNKIEALKQDGMIGRS